MRQMRLTIVEHAQLAHTCQTTSARRLRERCQAVLMASRGRQRGYPFNAGHSAASMTYRNSLTALSGHGQRVKLR
jgi:hypothetical protein